MIIVSVISLVFDVRLFVKTWYLTLHQFSPYQSYSLYRFVFTENYLTIQKSYSKLSVLFENNIFLQY